jgi:hypothetical protein
VIAIDTNLEVNMATEQKTLQEVIESARQLTLREKAQLIAQIIPDVEAILAQVDAGRKPLRSVYGLCRDLGAAPSADDIDEARRELFREFPRTDIS